jgi:hypothetical protein
MASDDRRLHVALIGLAVYALLTTLGAVAGTRTPGGAIDFHSYWYYGHFVRQGHDPYAAFFAGAAPDLPVAYLDGPVATRLPIAQPGLVAAPVNTAPLVCLLSVFAWFSWPVAKSLWLACNLALMTLAPWLVVRLVPIPLRATQQALIALVFWALLGTRSALVNGQTSLLVLVLMLAALWLAGRHDWLAGLLLGLALSKYSVALPGLLVLALARRWRVLLIALGVQVASVLGLALVTGSAPLDIVGAYAWMFGYHAGMSGIHLASLFPKDSPFAGLAVALGSALVWGVLARWWFVRRGDLGAGHGAPDATAQLHLLAVVALWTLLVAYHRAYDTVLFVCFVALAVYALAQPERWGLSRRSSVVLAAFLVLVIAALSAPGEAASLALPGALVEAWKRLLAGAMTLALAAATGCALWLMWRCREWPVNDARPPASPERRR